MKCRHNWNFAVGWRRHGDQKEKKNKKGPPEEPPLPLNSDLRFVPYEIRARDQHPTGLIPSHRWWINRENTLFRHWTTAAPSQCTPGGFPRRWRRFPQKNRTSLRKTVGIVTRRVVPWFKLAGTAGTRQPAAGVGGQGLPVIMWPRRCALPFNFASRRARNRDADLRE